MVKQSTKKKRYARKKATSKRTLRTTQKYDNLGAFLFPFVLVLFSFTILIFNIPFTDFLLEKNTLDKESIPVTHQLLDYFQGQADMPDVFTEKEASHMTDVGGIVRGAIILFFFLIILLTWCVHRGNRSIILKRGSLLLLALIILGVIIPFDTIFLLFHQLVFPQGNYLFPNTGTLLQFYPNIFFAMYGLSIVLLSLLITGILWLAEIVSSRG